MREFKEKELNKLTKKELLHLVCWMLPTIDIEASIKSNQRHQKKMDIDCWECKSIARKLDIKEK